MSNSFIITKSDVADDAAPGGGTPAARIKTAPAFIDASSTIHAGRIIARLDFLDVTGNSVLVSSADITLYLELASVWTRIIKLTQIKRGAKFELPYGELPSDARCYLRLEAVTGIGVTHCVIAGEFTSPEVQGPSYKTGEPVEVVMGVDPSGNAVPLAVSATGAILAGASTTSAAHNADLPAEVDVTGGIGVDSAPAAVTGGKTVRKWFSRVGSAASFLTDLAGVIIFPTPAAVAETDVVTTAVSKVGAIAQVYNAARDHFSVLQSGISGRIAAGASALLGYLNVLPTGKYVATPVALLDGDVCAGDSLDPTAAKRVAMNNSGVTTGTITVAYTASPIGFPANSSVQIDTAGKATVGVQVTANTNVTLGFFGSVDGSVWQPLYVRRQDTQQVLTSDASGATGNYLVPCSGLAKIAVGATVIGATPTATVALIASPGTINFIGKILAASTAPGVNDPSLVVGISPNTPSVKTGIRHATTPNFADTNQATLELDQAGSQRIAADIRHFRRLVLASTLTSLQAAGTLGAGTSLSEGPCSALVTETDNVVVYGQPTERLPMIVQTTVAWGAAPSGWTLLGTVYTHTASGGTTALSQDTAVSRAADPIISSKTYCVRVKITGRTAGSVVVKLGTATGSTTMNDNGIWIDLITANGTTFNIVPTTDFDGSIDVVEVWAFPRIPAFDAKMVWPFSMIKIVCAALQSAPAVLVPTIDVWACQYRMPGGVEQT